MQDPSSAFLNLVDAVADRHAVIFAAVSRKPSDGRGLPKRPAPDPARSDGFFRYAFFRIDGH
jgi:hypothetical protein